MVDRAERYDIVPQTLMGNLLIDVTVDAWRAGVAGPTAITANVWHDLIALPLTYIGAEDEADRLATVLRSAAAAANRVARPPLKLVEFQVALCQIGRDGRDSDRVTRAIWVFIGRGDHGRALRIIMSARDF